MSYYLLGTDVAGAMGRTSRLMRLSYGSYEMISNPQKVIVSVKGAASTIYANPNYEMYGQPAVRVEMRRIVVWGGERWWLQQTRNYTDPVRAWILFADGTSKTFTNLASVAVTGGTIGTSIYGVGAVVGTFDVAATQHSLNAMKKLTVAQARLLLNEGQKIIEATIASAGSLPGDGARQDVRWRLRWHAEKLAKATDGPYASADDLKKWVQQAVIESNAVGEGLSYKRAAWDQMISEIEARASELPQSVADAWRWVKIGAVVVGVVAVIGFAGIYVVPLLASARRR